MMTCFRDDCLVRVKAQVMTRDESTGGWVPSGRGGMSVVGLRRLTTAAGEDISTEYRLHGQRIADQSVWHCALCRQLVPVSTWMMCSRTGLELEDRILWPWP